MLLVHLAATDAASINAGPRKSLSIVNAPAHALRNARQAYSDEEDSDEEDDVAAQNLVQQQQQQQYPEDSQEDSDEDGDDESDDDSRRHRRRRDATAAEAEKIEQSAIPLTETEAVAVPEPLPAPATSEQAAANQEPEEQSVEGGAPTVAATPATPARNTSVLILIRDALKKVTTLPTEQVATNALQYFQLFEHFIQQTIENVIGDDDDDDDEAGTAALAAAGTGDASTSKPDGIFTPEEEEIIAGVEEILKEPELVMKQPQEVKPAETQMELTNGAAEAEGSTNVIGETKPAIGSPKPEKAQETLPAANAGTAKNSA